METRNQRKVRVGRVVSDKMDKTIVVSIERKFSHPIYKKTIRKFSKLYAHDESNQARTGDVVRLMEMRPLSRLKRWRLMEVVVKAQE